MPLHPVAAGVLDFGTSLLSNAIGASTGYQKQKKLQALQIRGAKELADYSHGKQLDLWNATNYAAQVAHLNKAGLNPAMLYGQGGAGGATAQAPAGGMPSGASADQGRLDIKPMAMQLALLESQRKNIDADTKLKETEADKKAGVDTEEAKQRIESLFQGTENARLQHQIQKLDITLKNIENFEKQATQEDRLDYIDYQSKIAMKQLAIIANDKDISDATKNNAIQMTTVQLIAAQLHNLQTKAQTGLTQAQTLATQQSIRESEKKISMWYQQNMRDWDKLSQADRQIRVQELMKEWQTDPNREATQQILGVLGGASYLMKPGATTNEYIDTKTIVIPKKN